MCTPHYSMHTRPTRVPPKIPSGYYEILRRRQEHRNIAMLSRVSVFLAAGFQAFSPWIVAITRLVCLLARNSRYQMPCHVPVALCGSEALA